MTTPSDSPEINRLRRGKSRARGSQPSGISVSAAPVVRMSSSRSICSFLALDHTAPKQTLE
jgi:hypothetical protein